MISTPQREIWASRHHKGVDYGELAYVTHSFHNARSAVIRFYSVGSVPGSVLDSVPGCRFRLVRSGAGSGSGITNRNLIRNTYVVDLYVHALRDSPLLPPIYTALLRTFGENYVLVLIVDLVSVVEFLCYLRTRSHAICFRYFWATTYFQTF